MKKVLGTCMVIAAAALAVACSKPASTTMSTAAAGGSDVVATVGGVNITMDDLNAAAKDRLAKIDMEIYQVRKQVLDDMVEKKLIEEAAKKKGVAPEKFVAEEVDAKVSAPSEEEMKALYDARKGSTDKKFEEVKPQIEMYLKQNRKMQAKAELLAKLREGADVKVNLEPPRVTIDTKGAYAMGDDGAKITLVEFSDYQCPFCKRVRATVWRLIDEYKGKIRYVFMDFPLSFHKNAKKAHEAAWCAGDQGKYFEYNRKIFDNQDKIEPDNLKEYAKELKLDAGKFNKCLDGGEHAKDVEEMQARGMKVGVTGTPAYFINGIMISGAQPYESFKDVIEGELQR